MTLGARYTLAGSRPTRTAVIVDEPRRSHDGTIADDAKLWYLFTAPLRKGVTWLCLRTPSERRLLRQRPGF